MRTTITALATIAITALVAVLTTLTPVAATALADPAVCTSDLSCMQYDAGAEFTAPVYDAQDEAHCPAGQRLFDTENPDMGDSGVVCTSLYEEV